MRKFSVYLVVLLGVLLLISLSTAQIRVEGAAEDEVVDSDVLTTEEEALDGEVDIEEFATEEDEGVSADFIMTEETLPTKYIGAWKGEGVQNNPPGRWTILLALTRGSTQSIVGAIAYPSLSCGGELTLRSVKADSIELLEDITYGNCVDRGIITLRLMADGDFDYSWRNQNGSDTATGSLSKISKAGTAISVQYLGVWRGTGKQTNPSSEWSILLALTNGRIRATVGAIAYPSLSCGGELILQDISADSIKLFENITYGTPHCVDNGIVTLKLTANDKLKYQWHSPDVTSTATGSLVRISERDDQVADSFTYPVDRSKAWRNDYDGNTNRPHDWSVCYNVYYNVPWHAGQDYGFPASKAADGTWTNDTPVNAVANGIVRYSSKDPETTKSYPGGVVIIEHTLPDGQLIYSMYGHLDPSKILVSASTEEKVITVIKGQQIATGLVPQVKIIDNKKFDNTHLHWEMRYFYDGSEIKQAPNYTGPCTTDPPGPGYTYHKNDELAHPDNFKGVIGKNPDGTLKHKFFHWTNPEEFVADNQ